MGSSANDRPLCIDLFCGLGGWAEGFLAEGYRVIGFDIERHDYGNGGYPGQLVLQDVLTLHGSQFRDATVIVASPPCQKYSYMAMPWSKAKALIKWYEESAERRKELNALFDACFRIQREASEAAGRHIPMVVENVRGAQRWVGRAKWNFGSYYLWGDVPALMPITPKRPVMKRGVAHRSDGSTNFHQGKYDGQKVPGFRFDGSGRPFQTASVEETGFKSRGMNWSDQSKRGQDFTRIAGGQKTAGHVNRRDGHAHTRHLTNQAESDAVLAGVKQRGSGREWFAGEGKISRVTSSKSDARRAASAAIAKIPFPLARYLARTFIEATPVSHREQE